MQTMLLITTNHYRAHKYTKHKKVMIFFFKFKEHEAFKQSKKPLIWRKKKKKKEKQDIAGTLPFFLPVKYPKSQGKDTIQQVSFIQEYLNLQ